MDVCNAASVAAAFQAASPSVVIHCAAYGVNYAEQDFDRALAVNVHGSLNVLAAAARSGVRRFIHVGSAVEYGSYSGRISEEAALKPTAIYGATKAAATLLLQERARALGLPLVVVRPFAMWGPGEAMAFLIPQVVNACITRTPLKLTGCEVIRDYSYVEDVAADIVALALRRDDTPHTLLNLGSGEAVVLRDLVVAIARILDGVDLMQFGALPYRSTEMRFLAADTTRVREILGRRATTSMEEGVRRTVARLRSQQL
jgi:nucleoside-diphosphate-sugar epimerase